MTSFERSFVFFEKEMLTPMQPYNGGIVNNNPPTNYHVTLKKTIIYTSKWSFEATYPTHYYQSGKKKGQVRSYMPNAVNLQIKVGNKIIQVPVKLHDAIIQRPVQSGNKRKRGLRYTSGLLDNVIITYNGNIESQSAATKNPSYFYVSITPSPASFLVINEDKRNGRHLVLQRNQTYFCTVCTRTKPQVEIAIINNQKYDCNPRLISCHI